MEARKIIITGGAPRIGAAIAKKLSGQNNEILISDIEFLIDIYLLNLITLLLVSIIFIL